VLITGNGTDNNHIQFNDIGYNSVLGDNSLSNGGAGVRIAAGATTNSVGPLTTSIPRGSRSASPQSPQVDEKANFIWYNVGPGIQIDGANGNLVLANSIENNAFGVDLNNSDNTEINFVSMIDNTGAGINERGGSNDNTWSKIAMSNNSATGGIVKSNATPPPPSITSIGRTATHINFAGTASGGATVEVYVSDLPRRALAQGQKYVGTTVAQGNGSWSLTVPLPVIPSRCFVAFQTIGGDSSAFNNLTCRLTYVPLATK
jgi:hypothetical protein